MGFSNRDEEPISKVLVEGCFPFDVKVYYVGGSSDMTSWLGKPVVVFAGPADLERVAVSSWSLRRHIYLENSGSGEGAANKDDSFLWLEPDLTLGGLHD